MPDTQRCPHGFDPDEECEACTVKAQHIAGLPEVGSDEWYDRADRIIEALRDQFEMVSASLTRIHRNPQRPIDKPNSVLPVWEACTQDEARAYDFERQVSYMEDITHAVFDPEPGDPWDAK
jgi:hypothetical protein